jgi:hypothetical protein
MESHHLEDREGDGISIEVIKIRIKLPLCLSITP